LDRQPTYSHQEIEEICAEIELQWECHLISRAAFPSGLMNKLLEYESPQFYSDQGVSVKVRVALPLSQVMERRLGDVGHWLNQNYIIRLFGILNQDGVITAGKNEGNPYTLILALLRQRVGTHSRGYRNPKSREVRRLTKLIEDHLNTSIEPKDAQHFDLAIDTILYALKEHCVVFIRSLEGKSRPNRKPVASLGCRIFSALLGLRKTI
jgi:hypothetical protein